MAVNIYTGIGQRSSVQAADQARINVRISPWCAPHVSWDSVDIDIYLDIYSAGGDRLEMLYYDRNNCGVGAIMRQSARHNGA